VFSRQQRLRHNQVCNRRPVRLLGPPRFRVRSHQLSQRGDHRHSQVPLPRRGPQDVRPYNRRNNPQARHQVSLLFNLAASPVSSQALHRRVNPALFLRFSPQDVPARSRLLSRLRGPALSPVRRLLPSLLFSPLFVPPCSPAVFPPCSPPCAHLRNRALSHPVSRQVCPVPSLVLYRARSPQLNQVLSPLLSPPCSRAASLRYSRQVSPAPCLRASPLVSPLRSPLHNQVHGPRRIPLLSLVDSPHVFPRVNLVLGRRHNQVGSPRRLPAHGQALSPARFHLHSPVDDRPGLLRPNLAHALLCNPLFNPAASLPVGQVLGLLCSRALVLRLTRRRSLPQSPVHSQVAYQADNPPLCPVFSQAPAHRLSLHGGRRCSHHLFHRLNQLPCPALDRAQYPPASPPVSLLASLHRSRRQFLPPSPVGNPACSRL